jgi:DNA-binding response OmpR family regulator
VAATVLLAVERQFAAALLAASLGEAGFELRWTASFQSSGQFGSDEAFDAILVDLSQPSPAAMRAVETLADEPGGPPVIAITPDATMPLPTSIRFVVRKPFTGEELIDTVRAAVISRQAHSAAVVPFRAHAAAQATAVPAPPPDQEV